MPRYKLTIAYDGTDFCGWQKQEPPAPVAPESAPPAPVAPGGAAESSALASPITSKTPASERDIPMHAPPANKVLGLIEPGPGGIARLEMRTVQAVVERAVREIVREPVTLTGASRTDAGVHARGQVASFACSDGTGTQRGIGWPVERGTDRLRAALNGRLPADVLITAIEPCPIDFDPIRGATSKAYSYTIHDSRERPLWDRRFVCHVPNELDERAMHDAAQRLVGEHDFAAFAAAGHGRLTTVRRVFSCGVARLKNDDGTASRRVRIDITGSGFLWNMVRIIAGTLCEVGRGRMTSDEVTKALESKVREDAGPTMPPEGLCLEWIRYAEQA